MTLKLKVDNKVLGLIFFVLIGSILSYIYLKPFLEFRDTMFLRLDWHKEFQQIGATWIAISKFHEFPIWNPYTLGGNFLFAHPESEVLSPETLFILLAGPITGMYYSVLFFYILGFVGCYFLGRQLKLTYLGTLYLAVVFTFTSYVMNNLFMGASMWKPFGYIPFMIYFLLKAESDWRYGIPAGLFHALAYFGGAIYIYMMFLPFAGIFVVSKIIETKKLVFLKGFATFLIFSFLFASLKIIPNLDIYDVNKRDSPVETPIPFGLDLMHKAFLDKHQAWNIVSGYTYKGVNFHFPSYGAYLGIIPVLFALLGIILNFRNFSWALTLLGAALLYLSDFEPFSFIWRILHSIPPFMVLTRPARSIIFLTFMVAIVGAIFISKIDKIRIKNNPIANLIKKAVIFSIILFVFSELTNSSHIITTHFQPLVMPPGVIAWEEPLEYYSFYDRINLSDEQVQLFEANYIRSFSHFDTLSNKGSIRGVYDPMGLPFGKIRSKGDEDYRGEYYFENGDDTKIELVKRTSSKIFLKVETKQDNLLLINQNYHKAWKSKENFEIINKDGLVAVKVPKESHNVSLYVFQDKIFIGLVMFLTASLIGIYVFLGQKINPFRASKKDISNL